MKKRWFLVGVMFLLVPWLLVGCGIPQEQYDAVVAERDSLVAKLQSVQSDLDATKSKLQSTQSELTTKGSELQSVQSELETVKLELEEALTQLIEAQAPVAPPPPTVEGQTYTNSEYGFSCDFPKDWSVEEGVGAAVLFAGPVAGEYDYMVNISVMVAELPIRWKLDEFVRMDNLQTKQLYPDFTVLQEYETTIGGLPAIVQVISLEAMGVPLKDAIAYTIKDKVAYSITLDVTADLYEQYRDEFALVITTFKFD